MSNKRTIVISLNPSNEETKSAIEWILNEFDFRKTDSIILVSGIALDADIEALSKDHFIQLEKENKTRLNEELNKIKTHFESLKISISCKLIEGRDDPRKLISDYVESINADLLILGNSDLSGWQRFWTESFSDFCVHSVHCPVLIIKKRKN